MTMKKVKQINCFKHRTLIIVCQVISLFSNSKTTLGLADYLAKVDGQIKDKINPQLIIMKSYLWYQCARASQEEQEARAQSKETKR